MRLDTRPLLATRLFDNLRLPLYRNAFAWMLSTAVSSGLGIVYWIIAARFYSPEIVGISAAAVSALIFLSGVLQLNLASALVRFIPRAGQATGRFVLASYVIPIVLTLLLGSLIAVGTRLFSVDLNRVSSIIGFDARFVPWFLASLLIWSVFVLQDSVLTGLRDAIWVPVENISYSVIKIVLLIIFAQTNPTYGIFASWVMPVVAAILPVNLLIFRRLIPRHVQVTGDQSLPLVPAQLLKFIAANYAGSLSLLTSTRLVPVLVTNQAGAQEGAYFFIAWMIASTIKLITTQMAMSFTVEGAQNPAGLRRKGFRFLKNLAAVFLPLIALLVFAAPYILQLMGNRYSTEGTTVLRLLALSMIPNLVTVVYISAAQVNNQMKRIFTVQFAFCVMALSLSFLFLRLYGIVGVGIAFLASESIIAFILILPQLFRFLPRERK